MSIEEAMMGGIVFKGKKERPKEENKVKTKAKKHLPKTPKSVLRYSLIPPQMKMRKQ